MTNRRANYPPMPGNRHEVRKTKPFALHRTPMSEAVERAMREMRARRKAEREPHPIYTPAPWPWNWYEKAQRAFRKFWLRLKNK